MERRNDDDLGVLQTRLQEFHTKTEPLAAFYNKVSVLHRIDGNRDRDAVFSEISRLIEDKTRNDSLQERERNRKDAAGMPHG